MSKNSYTDNPLLGIPYEVYEEFQKKYGRGGTSEEYVWPLLSHSLNAAADYINTIFSGDGYWTYYDKDIVIRLLAMTIYPMVSILNSLDVTHDDLCKLLNKINEVYKGGDNL